MSVDAGIAIVSGSSDRRRFLKSVLDGAEYLTFQAIHRADAMRLLATRRISVFISDLHLSDGDWKDFLSVTAEMSMPPRLIVISPAASRLLWAEVLNLGGFDVIEEPLDAEEVRRTVERAARTWEYELELMAPSR